MHLFQEKPRSREYIVTILALAGLLAACKEPPPAAETAETAPAEVESTCGELGRLSGALSGAIGIELDWTDGALRCESMPRPDSEGIRMRFSVEVSGERLAIILAMPELQAGITGEAFDTNVTITVENSGRFFSTPNLDSCWTDVVTNEPLADPAVVYNVVGSLSCVAPLGEVNGDAFIDIRDLQFSGVADWTGE